MAQMYAMCHSVVKQIRPMLYIRCSSLRDTGKCECRLCQYVLTNASTLHFPYIETCWVGKWGKTKETGGARCEAHTCFKVRNISEK